MKLQHNHDVWHRVKANLVEYLEFLYGIAKWIGWFISDVKWKYIMSKRHGHELCSKCFKLMPKWVYNRWFDYKGKTFYVCKDCYNNLHNK